MKSVSSPASSMAVAAMLTFRARPVCRQQAARQTVYEDYSRPAMLSCSLLQ
jgi:hypothetical protein